MPNDIDREMDSAAYDCAGYLVGAVDVGEVTSAEGIACANRFRVAQHKYIDANSYNESDKV